MEILAGLLIFVGLLGSFLPILPGPPLSFVGLLLYAYAKGFSEVGTTPLIIFAVLTILSIILDFFAPVIASKRNKPSRIGTTGVIAGSILGIFLGGPFGILIGALAGGFLGEYLATRDANASFKITVNVLVGFLVGTLFRLAVSLAIAIYFVILLF